MVGTGIERIEASVDSAAAAVYAVATAVVLHLLDASGVYVVVGAGVAFVGCLYGLRSIEPDYVQFALPAFEPNPIDPVELEELLLTDADRLRPHAAAEGALLLDDILAEIGPNSRVVRMFDRDAMPTPGQLQARIETHLGEANPPCAPPDASQALHDALANLRRSLG